MTLDDVYDELLETVSVVGARIDVPYEAERFFKRLVEEFEGTREELLDHVRSELGSWFVSLGAPPEWLQDAEWQFFQGRPMAFVGQIDLPPEQSGLHDDASFFVFWDRESGVTETVVQVA